jgi:hypothetical protein
MARRQAVGHRCEWASHVQLSRHSPQRHPLGAQVTGNHVTVRLNTTCWSQDGYHLMTGADTNESASHPRWAARCRMGVGRPHTCTRTHACTRVCADRCYELGGWENNVTDNTGFCGHQQAANTPYMTVDGEGASTGCGWSGGTIIPHCAPPPHPPPPAAGILDQLWDSVNGFRNVLVRNNLAVEVDGRVGQTGFIS